MPVVRYPEILADLRAKILDGTHPVGEPLPHTSVLKETYGVGAHVITRAMKELKEEGLIWRVANRGMIVQRPATSIEIPLAIERRDEPTEWASACRRAGATGRLTPQPARAEAATEEVARDLHLAPNAAIITWDQHGDIDGQLVCLDRTYVSAELHEAGDFDIERSAARLTLRLQTSPASIEEASKLRVSHGSLLIDITRITHDSVGQPIQLLRRLLNPQRVHVSDRRLPLTSP
ncbi:GntR family transcriptional regulator [Nonomuraea typhae]|uniref:GntR family transcriptional regulator n=1 Tax=Nonomuraea typhae TaxID=2603600 RepID=A0ABW7YMS3_9ACTN